jgi:hypothetical protein
MKTTTEADGVGSKDSSAGRPAPTEWDQRLAEKIVYLVLNLPVQTYGEANDAIAQVIADARSGYQEPIGRPTVFKPNVQAEPRPSKP